MVNVEKMASKLVRLVAYSEDTRDAAYRGLHWAEAEYLAVMSVFEKAHVYKYPRASHTVDGIILRDNEVLLIKRGNRNEPFYGYWALPGGFMDEGESLEEAFCREMKEELNLNFDPKELSMVGTFSAIDRDPRGRVISTVFQESLEEGVNPVAGDDAAELAWFPLTDLPPLAFDHEFILRRVCL